MNQVEICLKVITVKINICVMLKEESFV